MHRLLIIITVAVGLSVAGMATAAGGGTTVVKISPNRVSAASAESVSITNIPSSSTLPRSIAIVLQGGFKGSAKSVSVLCTAKQLKRLGCPSGSQVGTGSAKVTVNGLPGTFLSNLFLGVPLHPGDIASVYMVSSSGDSSLTSVARLLAPARGKVEFLYLFPVLSAGAPPVSLSSFSIRLHASRTVTSAKGKNKLKTVYSLITNPSTCTGTWTGNATLTYASATSVLPLSTPCVAK